MPSRPQSLFEPALTIGVGLVLSVIGGLDQLYKLSGHGTFAELSFIAGVFLVPFGLLWLRREWRTLIRITTIGSKLGWTNLP
jgi:hypothetical protein